jgi:DNA-binding response OmpR family regulator
MTEATDILLADDSEVGRYVIATMLRRAGFHVREVADGADAVAEATREPPDLALFDVKMPQIDGMEACRRLKANPATSFIPVVLLSATFLDSADQVEGLDIGADAYLTQPVEAPVLIASINSLLRARSAERRERLAASEWRVTFDAIGDAVALVDPTRQVRRCNRAFAALALLKPADTIGRSIDELLPELKGTEIVPTAAEQAVQVRDRRLRIHIDELPDPEAAGHVVLSLRDITAEFELAVERERVFRREQLVSATLQQALALRHLPTVPGLRLTARYVLGESDIAVGGDWFDAIQTDRGVWLVIGDVAGHGVAAAAQAVQLRLSLRLLADEGYGPAEAMSRLGEVLVDGQLIETATAAIAAIDPSLSEALIVCAGHPPAILIGADGRSRRVDEPHGPVLGYPGGQHEAASIAIAEGETLVLYTDGLIERRDESIDDGIDRLQRVLSEASVADVAEHTFASLVPEPPPDDAAILVAHRLALDSTEAQPESSQTSVPPSVTEWPA